MKKSILILVMVLVSCLSFAVAENESIATDQNLTEDVAILKLIEAHWQLYSDMIVRYGFTETFIKKVVAETTQKV